MLSFTVSTAILIGAAMPEIHPFRGLRYNSAQVGSLSNVIAPPYDVVDAKLQKELYERSEHNFLRLELTQPEPGDQSPDDIYQRASTIYRNWKSDDTLLVEPDPAIYVYHQNFMMDGIEVTRRGFMCRVRLERFGEGKIYPHEQTHSKAKEDRLKLLRATEANFSQIFGLYPDPENEVQNLLESAVAGSQAIEATDHLGVVHQMWPVTDINVINQVRAEIQQSPMYVADGHHRYETACNYRDEIIQSSGGNIDKNHPANFVLTMLVSMSDPGMIVLPTHRLLHGVPEFTTADLMDRLSPYFEIETFATGAASIDQTQTLWDKIERLQDQTTFGLFSVASNEWILLRATEAADTQMKEIAAEQSQQWQELGVAMLHRLVFEEALGLSEMPKPTYVHQIDEVVDGLKGKLPEQVTHYSLAALVMPATLDHIREISLNNERMPAKSTYFFPKLVSGLVVNDHSL